MVSARSAMIPRNFEVVHYGGNREFPAAFSGKKRASPYSSSMYGNHGLV